MALRSMGVEEEMHLYDASTGEPASKGDVLADAEEDRGDRVSGIDHEFKLEQVEIGVPPCTRMEDLRTALVRQRRLLVERAATIGVDVAAIATSPVPTTPTLTPGDRYARMQEAFGHIARIELCCGMHVHVSVDSPEEGIGVIDRVRPWLSLLLAMSASSPLWQGQDTGMASYRTMIWGVWPTAGPTELFGDVQTYAGVVRTLVDAGAALDEGMIYFDARLSRKYPTVEVRIADVCPRVDDAVLVATLTRALVDTAARDWARGVPAPPFTRALLRASAWQAAKAGLTGVLLDGRTLVPVAALDALLGLVDHVAESLEASGELGQVRDAVQELCHRGTSAERQRQVLAASGSLLEVIRDAVATTADR